MSDSQKTFSESWYRVAPLHIKLRPQVKVHRQQFRGEKWFVLEDPFNNQFFRLRPAAWEFVSRLTGARTVERAWDECLEINPDRSPGQTEIIQMLSQLYQANLIYTDLPADVVSLFKRYRKRKQRELQSRALSFMFARFPLLDPDRFLKATLPMVGPLFSRLGILVWLVVVGMGLKVVVENFPALVAEGRDVLAPGNLFYFYLGIVFLAVLHEFGHAYACRRYGGEVHTLGIMLLVFTPLPYMDASASWAFRDRWKRIVVASSGMIFELFFASIAAMVWAATGPGTVHALAYNMMFAASISTLLFNANPLLRFDGYYILADLVNIPNLYGRAQKQLKMFAEKFLLGIRNVRPIADSRREAGWLTAYGISSGIYRVFVFAAIVFFVGQQFLIAGVLLAFFCVVAWVVVPAGKLIHFLATSPRLDRSRKRAVFSVSAVLGIPLALLYFVPFPHGVEAPGVVQSEEFRMVVPQTEGRLVENLAQSGERVVMGTRLFRLENPALKLELEEARARLEEGLARRKLFLLEASGNLEAVDALIASIREDIRAIEERLDNLVVKAPRDGLWVAPNLDVSQGLWLQRGQPAGLLLDADNFRFSAVVSQENASRLFNEEVRGAEIKVVGQSESTLVLENLVMIPMERRELPSAALGFAGGGKVATTGGNQREAEESFFEVRGEIAGADAGRFLHGISGRIRMELPPEPLLRQWIRRLRQLIQKHYLG